MAKKKGPQVFEKIETETSTATATETAPGFQPFVPSSESSKQKQRMSFGLADDGTIDIKGTREDTMKRLREILKDPRNREALGIGADKIISEEDAAQLLGMFCMIEAFAFRFAGKIEPDIAAKHASFNDEEQKQLIPPTQRVAAKYAPAMFLLYKDELMLGGMLLMLTRAKFDMAKKEQEARNEERKVENPALSRTIPKDEVSSDIPVEGEKLTIV